MTPLQDSGDPRYPALVKDLSGLLEAARRASARAVNALMTATYWEIGRRIVEFEQGGAKRPSMGRSCSRPCRPISPGASAGLFAPQPPAFSGVLPPLPVEGDSLNAVERIAFCGTPHDSLDSVEQFRDGVSEIPRCGAGRSIPFALVALRLAHWPRSLTRGAGLLSRRGAARRLVRDATRSACRAGSRAPRSPTRPCARPARWRRVGPCR